MQYSTNKFFWLGLFNLSVVAFLGVIMRYKIGFEFPFLNQKHLLHGHSHFAFAGWVTHMLYLYLVDYLQKTRLILPGFSTLYW